VRGFGELCSALTAFPANVYEIVLVAPAGIVTVLLSALALASGILRVSVHAEPR